MVHVCFALVGVDHNELVSLADKHFSNISLTHEYEIPAFRKCRFTGSEVITFCSIYLTVTDADSNDLV